MGASSSIVSDPFRDAFIHDYAYQLEKKIASDNSFRSCFIEFIKNGVWVDKLAIFEDHICNECVEDSIWKKFGYSDPSASPPKTVSNSPKKSPQASPSSRLLKKTIPPAPAVVPGWTMCSNVADVRAIFLVILLHQFYWSKEYHHHVKFQGISKLSSSDSEPSCIHDYRTTRTDLREMMLSAANAFDSSDLDTYLGKPTPTLLSDFKKAITSLPIHMNIIAVDEDNQQVSMKYESSGGRSYSFRSMRSSSDMSRSISLFNSSVTASVSEATTSASNSSRDHGSARSCNGNPFKASTSTRTSPPSTATLGSAYYSQQHLELLSSAITSQKSVKLAMPMSTDLCVLRALRPVHDPTGTCTCMVSVETVDRISISEIANLEKHKLKQLQLPAQSPGQVPLQVPPTQTQDGAWSVNQDSVSCGTDVSMSGDIAAIDSDCCNNSDINNYSSSYKAFLHMEEILRLVPVLIKTD